MLSPMMEEHDIHVSVCDVEIKEETIEITLKTFLDDLQLAVGLEPGEKTPDDYTSSDEMIRLYINKTIQLQLGLEQVDLELENISASNDAVWITLSANAPFNLHKRLEIGYDFLTEIYPDQTNIINIRYNKKKKTFSLNQNKKEISYEFE